MLEHFNKRKDRKICYLPFHDTWDKKTLITEIYTKPDELSNQIMSKKRPIWFIKKYDYYYSEFDIMFYDGYIVSSQIVVGENGIFGYDKRNGFRNARSFSARTFSYELFDLQWANNIDMEIAEYCAEEMLNERSVYKLNNFSDIRLNINFMYLKLVRSERSCGRAPPFNCFYIY